MSILTGLTPNHPLVLAWISQTRRVQRHTMVKVRARLLLHKVRRRFSTKTLGGLCAIHGAVVKDRGYGPRLIGVDWNQHATLPLLKSDKTALILTVGIE